ncbi:MAG: sigma 54-interacting transcriptional regulator, partial [Psychrobacter sp.]
VADLPLAMQVKLLRAIQEKTVRAIGDTKEIPVDIRILSATHKNLNRLVQDGAFRQDLYYRINVIELKLPTLNARRDDIPVLAEHFLAMIANEWQLETVPSLTVDACARLQHHNFAGNVRELRNILERAVTLAENSTIDTIHLGLADIDTHQDITNIQSPENTNNTYLPEPEKTHKTADQTLESSETRLHSTQTTQVQQTTTNLHPYRTNIQHFPNMIQPSTNNHIEALNEASQDCNNDTTIYQATQNRDGQQVRINELPDGQLPSEGLENYLQEQEKQLIITALKQTGWNKTQAAELLGTTFRSLRYRMKKLEIAEDQSES